MLTYLFILFIFVILRLLWRDWRWYGLKEQVNAACSKTKNPKNFTIASADQIEAELRDLAAIVEYKLGPSSKELRKIRRAQFRLARRISYL